MFDWNDLRYFLALARTGRMGAAARELGVDDSTVQRRVAAFEQAVGVTLVERGPTGYVLTTQGKSLLDNTAEVETAMYALHRKLSTLNETAEGRVRLSTLVTLGERIIRSGLLDRFHALHPGVTVEMMMDQRIADLAKGEADLAVRGGNAGSDALIGMKIADLPWGIFASRSFIERHGRPASIGDLARFPVVELADELEILPAAQWMEANTKGATVTARCGNVPSAVLAVKAGAGLAALPTVHAAMDDELVCVIGPLPALAYPVHLLVHKDLRKAPRVAPLFDYLRRELKPVLLTGTMRAS